jgi:hypothetical protein
MDEMRIAIWTMLKRKYPWRSTRELWEEAKGLSEMALVISASIRTVLNVARAIKASEKAAVAAQWEEKEVKKYCQRLMKREHRTERQRTYRKHGVFMAG